MPTVLIVENYRFYFFANEGPRPHVHVEKGNGSAKVWLDDTTTVERWRNLTASQRRRILKLVKQHNADLLKAWNEFFSSKRTSR